MSVTILQQPGAITFSRNPVLFSFKSDARLLHQGAKYTAMLSPIAFVGPFGFTLKYNGLALAFTAVAVPDGSGYQLTAGVAGTPTADFINRFAAELAGNFYLSRDFDIKPVSAPYQAVQLTARQTGDAYNISVADTQNLSLTKLQDGVTETYQSNFKLYTEVWAENADHSDFTKITEAFLETTDDGQADIDYSDLLSNVLLGDGYDRPNVRFPSASQDLLSCRKYYIVYAEAYGDKQTVRKLEKTPVKTALLGGISKEKLEEFAFPGYFSSGGLLNFLKQGAATLEVRPEQQEYLTLVTFNSGFGLLMMQFKIYFTDGSTIIRNGEVFASVNQYEKFTWPSGFEQNHFQLLDPTKIVQKYEAVVLNENSMPATQTITYYLDYNYKPYTRFFLYVSSFGAYDTKITYGKNSNQYEIVTSSASRTLQGQFHLVNGEQVNYMIGLNNTETYTTSFLSMRAVRSFRDLFLSIDKLEIRKGRAYPLEFTSKTINEHKDGDNLHALTFEMGFAYKEMLWTYDDKDDVPVGLYLNLPAGTIFPNMPQVPTVPANFYDYRYYLKTETYNQAEIDAKLALVIAQINANAKVSQQNYLTLQQLISLQNTTINNFSNTYYTIAQINDLLLKMNGGGPIVAPDPDNNTFYAIQAREVSGNIELIPVLTNATTASGNYALDPATGIKYTLRIRIVSGNPEIEPYT